MVGRGELTEKAWSSIESLLPRSGRRGGQWRDQRTVINGILWKGAHGSALAGFARAVWAMADVRRSTLSLAARGAMGSPPQTRADQIGRGGGGGLGALSPSADLAPDARCKGVLGVGQAHDEQVIGVRRAGHTALRLRLRGGSRSQSACLGHPRHRALHASRGTGAP
jgi:hypothetical protein